MRGTKTSRETRWPSRLVQYQSGPFIWQLLPHFWKEPVVVQYLLSMLQAREEGRGLVEYALIIALVSIVAIAALTLLGGNVAGALSTVAGSV